MRKIIYILAVLGLFIGGARAQESTNLQAILSHIEQGEKVPFNLFSQTDQETTSVADQIDLVLNQLLSLPPEVRPYVFPAVMDIARVPKKIRTHPEIAVWEGKKPTVIDPKFQAFADKYLDDLNPNMYIYLMPRGPVETESDTPVLSSALKPDPLPLPSLPRVIGVSNGYPAVSSLYTIPDALRQNPNRGILTLWDIEHLGAGLQAFEDFIAHKQAASPAFKSGYRALSRFFTDRFQERVNPFQEKLKRIRLLNATDELQTTLARAGWPDPDTFARTADAMAKAYRAARMSLQTAIVVRRYRSLKPDTKLNVFFISVFQMYEALPADIRLVDKHLTQVREAFIQSGNQSVLNAEVLDENRK